MDAPADGREIEQLDLMIRLRRVEVWLLPADAARAHGPHEPFTVFVMPAPYPPVGYQNGIAGRLIVEGPAAARFADTYRQLHAQAANPDASAAIIAPLAKAGSQ